MAGLRALMRPTNSGVGVAGPPRRSPQWCAPGLQRGPAGDQHAGTEVGVMAEGHIDVKQVRSAS